MLILGPDIVFEGECKTLTGQPESEALSWQDRQVHMLTAPTIKKQFPKEDDGQTKKGKTIKTSTKITN